MVSTTITYLLDPLCGWCYGASPVVQQLGQQSGIQLELAPTGLFAGAGGRMLDAAFAEYAWSNDQRIEKLTGQRFTQEYRKQVLKPGRRFNSAATTLALTAVLRTAPERELEVLKALQEARYVDALDTAEQSVVVQLLRDLQMDAAAAMVAANDAELGAANAERMRQAQGLKTAFGAQGVPALIVTDNRGSRLLRGNALYAGLDDLLAQIAAG